MKNPILNYELRHWLKSPMAYFLVISITAFAFVTMLGTGGYFDEPGKHTGKVNYLNTAYALTSNSFLFAKLLLFLVAIFFGFSMYRDYQHNSHHILYSYPLHKFQYLTGKYLSACILISLAVTAVYAAIWAGECLLGSNNPKITDFQSSAYFTACFFYLLFTLLIIGSFVFIVVTLTCNIYAGLITVICFVLLQIILESTLFNSPYLLAILDPFGQNAFYLTTKDWNLEIKNSATIPIGKYAVFNRIFWGIIALGSLYAFSIKFDFHHNKVIALGNWLNNKRKLSYQSLSVNVDQKVSYKFNIISKLKYVLHLCLYDVRYVVTSWLFILFSLFGVVVIFFLQLKVSNTGDFNLLPLTRLFLGAPLGIYTVIIVLSTFLFSGMIIERARTNKMHWLVDATPIKNWQLISSKIFTIMIMHIIQLMLFFITSVTIQLINGYHNIEIGLYFIQLFILTFPILIVWNINCIFSHSLLPNSFVSMFLLTCLWLGVQSLEQIGINTNLLKYNNMPFLEYSDFNGYSSQLKGYFLLIRYWIAVAILLIPGIAFIWKRGTTSSFSDRVGIVRQRVSPQLLVFLFVAVAHLVFNAFSLYQAEQNQIANELSPEQMKKALEQHKKNWQQYDAILQPKISHIDLELDIFPKQHRFNASGKYVLINHSSIPIDTIFIRTGFDEMTEINWDGKAHEIQKDEIMKCSLYQLKESLSPGDSLSFSFTIDNIDNTLLGKNSSVLRNGTFLKQDILPRLGYQFSEGKNIVNEHGYPVYHFYHRDAHEVTLKTKISTSKDQMAIAPGYLLSNKLKAGRNYFEYITTTPQKLNFSFHSGIYEVIKDSLRDVKIEVYCHKTHCSNTAGMIAGIKASLNYNSFFSEYPYKHIRIIEFPHTEESYAGTLAGNNIPTSELLFNINSKTMKSKIDMPYYVMAHELTHEWFGNQMKPAEAMGAKMLTESITEYITLCIYRNSLGEDMTNIFLKTQYERYRKGKTKAKKKESPLFQVEPHQDYIAYGKGAIAMNEISKSIGEKKMIEVLSLFLKKYGKNQEKYPTSPNFIALLKSQVSVSHHQVIDEWLMEVVDFNFEDISN